jgi:hypothetical protein
MSVSASEARISSNQANNGTLLPMTFLTGGSERVRIDTSGNVGIGTSSPGFKLDVNGNINQTASGYLRQTDNTNTVFWSLNPFGITNSFGAGTAQSIPFIVGNNNTERMRIDASGNLLVAKTTTVDTTVGVSLAATGRVASTLAASTDGTGNSYILYSTGASAFRFYVGMGGTVFATNTTISAISDQRLKENVQDLDVGLDAVMALKPRKFDWKEGKGKNVKNDRGWIAQEFEQVFPDMIDEWLDPSPEGEEPYKSVRADLIPVLVKAIQEQQAMIASQSEIINSLKTRIEALEGTQP